MKTGKISITIKLFFSYLFSPIYLPHILVFLLLGKRKKELIIADILRYIDVMNLRLKIFNVFIYAIHNDLFFRSVYYYRIGRILHYTIGWYRAGSKDLYIPHTVIIGGGIMPMHPYATFLNAERIGKNFTFLQCTTIGKKNGKKPIIGNNVTVGANVVIIGDVKVGDNVMIGAGSVVVKDIPDNCVVVGNPARIIKIKRN